MRILLGEGVVLPCVGVSNWVVSGKEGLTEEGVFVFLFLFLFFVSVCLYVWCIRWVKVSA